MKKNIFKILKYLIPFLVAVGLLVYAFQGVKLADVIESFKKADYRFIVASAVIALLSHLIRAYRWLFLLKPLGYHTKLSHSFLAVMTGYFVNLVIPRAGEVARCGAINKTSGVSITSAIGTIVLERIIDLIILLGVITLIFFVEFNRFSSYFIDFFQSKISFSKLLWLGLLMLVFLTVMIIIIYRFRRTIRNYSIYKKIKEFLKKVLEGILSIKKVKNKPAFILHTFLIWVCYYLMMYSLFFCFPETEKLGAWAGFVVFVAGGIGMAAPVQGGIGAYHLLVSQVLIIYALPKDQGIIFATFMHTVQTLVLIIFGGISLALNSLIIVKKTEESNEKLATQEN